MGSRSSAEEHVLGPAQADALGPVVAGVGGVGRRCRRWPAPRGGRRGSRRPSRGWSRTPGGVSALGQRHLAEHDSPAVPSMEIQSPSLTTVPPTVKDWAADAHGLGPDHGRLAPPRATTAAWLTRPPRAVRMPSAASMPCTSSGEVSLRTRITFSPRSAAACGVVGREVDPAHRRARARRPGPWSARCSRVPANCGCRTWSRWSAVIRPMASSLVSLMAGSLVMSTAMRSAARPVRLPTRVCSIHNLPCSMVNSVSHMSR